MAGVSTKEIKNRIRSMESTRQITKAMEMVAASKLRRAQAQVLSSRPYFGHNNLQSRFFFFFVKIYRNPSTIIFHRNSLTFVYSSGNGIAMPCQSLINRVIYYFINQVMKPSHTYITYVHRRSQTHMLHSF